MLTVCYQAPDPYAPENSTTSPNITTTLLRYATSLSSPGFLQHLLTVPLEAISCEAIAFSSDDNILNITYVNREGHCILQPLGLPQPSDIETSPVVSNDESRPAGSHLLALPQLHAFRALATRSVESLPLIGNGKKSLEETRVETPSDKVQGRSSGLTQDVSIGAATKIGQLFEAHSEVVGANFREGNGRMRGTAWTSDHLMVRTCRELALRCANDDVQVMDILGDSHSLVVSNVIPLEGGVHATKWIDESSLVFGMQVSGQSMPQPSTKSHAHSDQC
jgi:hypothetical protein